MLTEGIAKNTMHKIYAVDILPNAIIEQALFTENYITSEITENFIKLETVVDVNVLFDKSVLPQAIDSKENFTDVVITNFFISDSGKIGNKTHGEISGTFYGCIKPLKALKEEKKIIIDSHQRPINTEPIVPQTNHTQPINTLPLPRLWRMRGCFFKFLQLLGLLMLLLFMLRHCNSCNTPAPLPLPMLDSLSQDFTDTMAFQNSNTYITFNDWDKADNDRITVKINDEIIAKNVLITNALNSIQIKNLKKGNNTLEIIPTSFGRGNCTVNVEISDSQNTFRFQCNIKKGQTVKKNLSVN